MMALSKTRCAVLFIFISFASTTVGWAQSPGSPIENAGKPMTALEKHIHEVCKHVTDNNKTTDKLTEDDLADLPIGIVRQIGNGVYVIAIDSAYWNGKGWFFSAYASIKFPGSSKPIAFRASNIGFNKGGIASLSATKLLLASQQWITISDDVVLELPADGKNFVEFDCDGFKSVNIKGVFHFSERIIVPAADTTDHVKASFEINTSDLSNVMATVNIAPFKVHNIDDITFEVTNAVADFSDFVNPQGFAFPIGYESSYGESPQLWRGFFMEKLNIVIYNLNTEPITLTAQNVIIDDTGLSGTAIANDVVTIDKGSADGWAFAIDKLSLQLLQNSLASGTFAGTIRVPLLGDDAIAYSAEMEHVNGWLNYKFLVSTTEDKEYATKLSAYIKVAKGSTISVERKDGKTTASATLHGSLSIQNEKMEAKGIDFQNLVLLSRAPYIKAPDFSTKGIGPKAMGFPVRIENVSLKTVEEGRAALGFDVALNFMSEEAKGFSGKTTITIFAKLEGGDSTNAEGFASTLRQDWKYDGIHFNNINLECVTTALTLKGSLSVFDNDPQYGNGFRGSLAFSVKKILPREVQVNAYFGSKESFRYWHVDAYVPTATIPIVPPLSINGFIGGASYKMVRNQPEFKPDFTKLNIEESASGSNDNGTRNGSEEFKFVPDANAGLSFMAGVTLIAGSDRAFNSDAVLEVAFNASGGFRYAQFKGSGYFFVSLKKRERPSSGPQKVAAPVFADMNMLYDHENGVFHANLKTYMNLKDAIRGTGENNLMGEAVIHVDANDWYMYIGRPSQMLGVDLAHLAVAQGYLMVGTKMENMAPPPVELRSIMGSRDMSLVRDENTLAMGRGVALGLRFQTGFNTGNKISPFYAAFTIGGGADVMIRDFGNATCADRSGEIGFNGWYASGQAYVFMLGKIGLKVKGRKFDFLKLGLAALLQAKLPDPTFLKGRIAGTYSILGGLISGKFNKGFTHGEECELVTPGNELGEILVISDVTPSNGAGDVSVFSSPQVSFNTAIERELSMLNNQDEVNTYRIKLDEFNVLNNGQPIVSSQEWNAKRDVLALLTTEILPPQTSLKAFVKIHWEKKLSNGSWEPLKENGQIDYETKEVTFTTGTAPDFIPEENIVYTYPVKNQYNFLPKEYGQGYVKLRIGQSYLFQSTTDSIQWKYVARFQALSRAIEETDIDYEPNERMVNFSVPEKLTTQTVYKLTFIKHPVSAGTVDSNVRREQVAVNAGEGNELKVASNTLTGTITQDIEKELYSSAFRTSKFQTFSDKWATLSAPQDFFDIAIGNIAVIGKGVTLQETFDEFELKGDKNRNKPLVQVTASPENNWMKNDMGPLLYDLYPVNPAVTITHRNTDSLGVKPLKALRLSNMQENYFLNESHISSGVALPKSGPVKIMYFVSFISFRDYSELRNKAAALAISGNNSAGLLRLLSATGYTDLRAGSYPVNIRYTLPGTNEVTTEKQITIQF